MALWWYRRWRIGRSIRRYGRRIGATLTHDHGASDFYTTAQLDRTIRRSSRSG